MARTTSNKFAAKCHGCGKRVGAGEGTLVAVAGKWAVRCGCDRAKAEPLDIPSGWQVYRDGERVIVGKPEWQTCTSLTYGVRDAFGRTELREALAEAARMSDAEADARKRGFESWGRFESACDAGMFGATW